MYYNKLTKTYIELLDIEEDRSYMLALAIS
jgi:hypothetical protein